MKQKRAVSGDEAAAEAEGSLPLFELSIGIGLRHSSRRRQVLVWLCLDHYQSAVWVSGCTLTLCYHVLPFVSACMGEDAPRRQHCSSCLPLIGPSFPLPSPPLWHKLQTRTYCSRVWRCLVESEGMMCDLMTKMRQGSHHKHVWQLASGTMCRVTAPLIARPLKLRNALITGSPKLATGGS